MVNQESVDSGERLTKIVNQVLNPIWLTVCVPYSATLMGSVICRRFSTNRGKAENGVDEKPTKDGAIPWLPLDERFNEEKMHGELPSLIPETKL